MKLFLQYFFISTAFLFGCGSEDAMKRLDDQEYFPLAVGFYQIYSVDETAYSNQASTTKHYELKTEIVDSFQSLEGTIIYIIHRSKRTSENDAWEFIDTWSARINQFEAILNEGSISYVHIAFPLSKSKEWNANVYNNLPEDIYTIDSAGKSFNLEDGQSFTDCVIINQEEHLDDATYKEDRKEIYARNVGLIYKKDLNFIYCTDGGCFGQQIIESGSEYYQVLKEYGQN